jgi:hypothetical protein
LLLPSALIAAPIDPRLKLGRSQWLAEQYPQARTTLYDYRYSRNGKTPEVDYMLGTASCRVSGQRNWGTNLLEHVLYRYPLPPKSRQTVTAEWQRCRSGVAMPKLTGSSLQVGINAIAGASGRGKAGYYLNTETPNHAFHAVSVEPVDEAILQQRLVKIGDREAILAALRPVAPPGANIHVRGRYALVTTGGHSGRQIRTIQRRLDRYLNFLQSEFALELPEHYLALYLVQNNEELRLQAKRLHNLDVSRNTIGYAYQGDQSTIAIVPGMKFGTLFHELFHLVVRTSFGDIPQWLDEGVASLYEVSAFDGPRLIGLPNWRGPVLERLWQKRPPIEDLIRADWFTGDAPTTVADQAKDKLRAKSAADEMAARFAAQRYLMLFLQERGQLDDVFQAVYKLEPGTSDDPRGATVAAVASRLGPTSALQAAFDQWFMRTRGEAAVTSKRKLLNAVDAGPKKKKRKKKKCGSPQEQSDC